MSKKIRSLKPLAKTGAIILIALYGAALFADFIAPYSAHAEFRNHFFHPPTRIHFRDANGRLVMPYVMETHLADPGRHIYQEGSPIWIGCIVPEQNKNPYISEILERDAPFAVITNEEGVMATVASARETQEDSGIFFGQAVLRPRHLGKDFTVQIGPYKKSFVWKDGKFTSPDVFGPVLLTDPSGNVITGYTPRVERCALKLFVKGADYSVLGLFSTSIHLFGVDPPGQFFLLGTDQAGRDIFSRVLHGSRVSLTVGLIGVSISTLLGLWIGGIAGYAGGWTDSILMRTADVIMSIPALYLILSVRNIFPTNVASELTYALVIVVLGLTGWAAMARVIRGMVLALREEEFVLAARTLGAGSTRVLFRHILPNTYGYVIVRATLLIPAYILAEVTLSYLGIGIQEPAASWGNMLSAAQELRVLEDFPWILAPGIFLFLTVLGFNLLGDGLRQSARQTTKLRD